MIRTRWHIRIACDKECNQSGTKIDPEIKCPGIAFTLLNFHFLNYNTETRQPKKNYIISNSGLHFIDILIFKFLIFIYV